MEGQVVVMIHDAKREHDCSDRPNRRENEQIGPIDPAMQDGKIFGQSVTEHNHQEHQYPDREYRNLTARDVANVALTFSEQPAGAKKSVTKTQTYSAKARKRRKPANRTAGIFAVRELQSFDQGADRQAL